MTGSSLPFAADLELVAQVLAGLVAVVGALHLSLAFGLRRGELVWRGTYPRRLSPELRRRSLGYGVFLLVAAWVLLGLAGVVGLAPVPEGWHVSLGWVVSALLALMGLLTIKAGPAWERFLFGPIVVAAALLAGWLTLA